MKRGNRRKKEGRKRKKRTILHSFPENKEFCGKRRKEGGRKEKGKGIETT